MIGNDADLLLAEAGGDLFGLPLARVERITALPQLLSVPGAPDYLQGVMVLAGECVPVLDLLRRLGLRRETPWRLEAPLLVCRSGALRAGVVVDEVFGVTRPKPADRQLDHLFAGGLPAFAGAARTPRGVALVLDLARLLDLDLALPGSDLTLPESILEACRRAGAPVPKESHDR